MGRVPDIGGARQDCFQHEGADQQHLAGKTRRSEVNPSEVGVSAFEWVTGSRLLLPIECRLRFRSAVPELHACGTMSRFYLSGCKSVDYLGGDGSCFWNVKSSVVIFLLPGRSRQIEFAWD